MKPRNLRLLVMHVSTRCDQTCAHCSIWKGNGQIQGDLDLTAREAIIREAHSLGARSILFTGGEPLLCDHLEALARLACDLGLTVQIASNGLGLARAAPWLSRVVHEVYLSLDGPAAIHDGLRGAGMFARLKSAALTVASMPRRPRLVARSVISRHNAPAIEATVAAARNARFDAISFLPIDTTSDAFGGEPQDRGRHALSTDDVFALRLAIGRLAQTGELGGYVVEDERKLLEMARFLGEAPGLHGAPPCNAPEWSSVVLADGSVRPCFFQPPVPRARGASLREAREGVEYRRSLQGLGRGNATCASCVCPKHLGNRASTIALRVRSLLGRAPSRGARRVEVVS